VSTTNDIELVGGTVVPAAMDWWSMACKRLAPGTRHHGTQVFALSWDAYDDLGQHGWEESAWWVDPDTLHKVPFGTSGACLHEQRARNLPDGSRVTCFPPHGERPVTQLCSKCHGHGWIFQADENGEQYRIGCMTCDGSGQEPRPFSPLPADLTPEDLGVRTLAPGEPDPMDTGF
jgi:hypothetical protein